MPFDPNDPNAWINHITETPPFIRSLCKSLYHESPLVRWPQRALLCQWGMTSQDRIGVIDENDPDWTLRNMPAPERMLPPGDAQYDALVRQEDPEALAPGARIGWPFAAAAFKYTGGNVPQAEAGADAWRLLHLYAGAPAFDNGVEFDAMPNPKHYTQSAGLVAVHPVVHLLMAQHPCIVHTLRARAFTKFNYDPANYFPHEAPPDDCGFVI